MKAMILEKTCEITECSEPLRPVELPDPVPGEGEILIRINACGVCHTELDEIEGRTPPPSLPVVPGHQVVGRVVKNGPGTGRFSTGDRVGVGWIYSSCGKCSYCLSGRENLCEDFLATGRDVNGGYAELMTVPEKHAHQIPDIFADDEAAPLLCAGAIGYRSMSLTGISGPRRLGLTGFGASGHLVMKMVRHLHHDMKVYVFARSSVEREFALDLGAEWAGSTTESSPELLDAIIDTTPVWKPVVEALRNLAPGGRLVINAIRKEDVDKEYLLNLDYPTHLWMEKEIKSVANVTGRDIGDFLDLAGTIPIRPETEIYDLEEANKALFELKDGKIRGAKVLTVG
jgi:propanol-preferring alcohol dehydrogenase